jgi:hypothetical protein
MNRQAFGILVLCIAINFGVGIVSLLVENFEGYNPLDVTPGVIEFNESYNSGVTSLSGNIKPVGTVNANSFSIFRILDTIGLGVVVKVLDSIGDYVYGLPNILDKIFGATLIKCDAFGDCDTTLHDRIFDAFYIIITLIYIFSAILMLTGKSPKAE